MMRYVMIGPIRVNSRVQCDEIPIDTHVNDTELCLR